MKPRPRCKRCFRDIPIYARGLCNRCHSRVVAARELSHYPKHQVADHVYCPCPEPNYDANDECRRCKRADLRAPRVAAAFNRVAERLGVLVPT